MNNDYIESEKRRLDQKYIEAYEEMTSAYENRSLKDHTDDKFKEDYSQATDKYNEYKKDMKTLCDKVDQYDKNKAQSLKNEMNSKIKKFDDNEARSEAKYIQEFSKNRTMQNIYRNNW